MIRSLGRFLRKLRSAFHVWLWRIAPPKPIPGNSGATFQLVTAPLEIPPELPPEVAGLLREQRARLESGALFQALAVAPGMGARVEACIEETGVSPSAHHLRVDAPEPARRRLTRGAEARPPRPASR
jgi:hypothetical protein